MIDIAEVTEMVFRETRTMGESMKFDSLELTPEEQFARSCAQCPLPTKENARFVIEEVFWASMLTEESRPCRPCLIYCPRSKDRGNAAHWLGTPVPLNRDSLRKLTPTQGNLGYLIWDCELGSPEIIGVEGSHGGVDYDFTIAAPGYGALDISWHCLRIVALRGGRLNCRSQEFLPDEGNALNVACKLLDSFEPTYLRHTIRSITRDGHGGAVWTLKEGHGLDGIQIGHAIQRSNPPPREKHQQLFKWLESVGDLAGVDGAVLIDSKLRVLGFGCFVEIPSSPRDVLCLTGINRAETRLSTSLGGGRHRSAVEFCCQFAPAAAIVVSEDGRISLMWSAPNEPPFWAPLSILGFSGDLR
jgi:hypothetical protein